MILCPLCIGKDLSSLIFRVWAGTQEISQQAPPYVSSDKGHVCQDIWEKQEETEQKESSYTEKRESMIWRRKTRKKEIGRLFSTLWFRDQTTLKSSDNVIFHVQPDIGVQTYIAKEQCAVEI